MYPMNGSMNLARLPVELEACKFDIEHRRWIVERTEQFLPSGRVATRSNFAFELTEWPLGKRERGSEPSRPSSRTLIPHLTTSPPCPKYVDHICICGVKTARKTRETLSPNPQLLDLVPHKQVCPA
ncbi:hypothetical protein J6590_044926 [Homalodisca vitripennis]|nr:hypothetical protein J6590_044926 [Homalodisca vitripennis]